MKIKNKVNNIFNIVFTEEAFQIYYKFIYIGIIYLKRTVSQSVGAYLVGLYLYFRNGSNLSESLREALIYSR